MTAYNFVLFVFTYIVMYYALESQDTPVKKNPSETVIIFFFQFVLK